MVLLWGFAHSTSNLYCLHFILLWLADKISHLINYWAPLTTQRFMIILKWSAAMWLLFYCELTSKGNCYKLAINLKYCLKLCLRSISLIEFLFSRQKSYCAYIYYNVLIVFALLCFISNKCVFFQIYKYQFIWDILKTKTCY